MWWWWAPIALAVEEPREVEIEPAEPLPSALDDLDDAAREVELEAPELEDWVPLPGALLRGRWYAKPLLSWTHLPGDEGGGAVRLGAALGHQWWTLDSLPVQVGGESRLEVTAPIGGARGRRIELNTVAGPWLGPVGVRLGPSLRWDRDAWFDGALLDNALAVGALGTLSVGAGPVRVYGGVEPAWLVAGTRSAADPAEATLPVLGDETTWRAGLGWIDRPVNWTLEGALRETAAGSVLEVGLGVHFRPF